MSTELLIPDPPHTQCLSSNTFSPPPLDGSLTLPEIYEWHSKNSPDHRLFVFSSQDGAIRSITWSDVVRAIRVGASKVRSTMGWMPGRKEIPVIAILAASDSISYFTMVMAILRAGYIAFPISTRNSPEAIAHLIRKVNVKALFIGHEPAITDLGRDTVEISKASDYNLSNPQILPIPLFDDLFLIAPENFDDDISWEKRGLDEIVMYLHSSGSTAFPKPIARTNRRLIEIALVPYFGERDLCDTVFSLHAVPMYHGMGIAQLCWTASCGLINGVFEPKSPAQLATPTSHFDAAVAVDSDFIFCVPAVIEAWSRKADYIKWLATRGGVIYGGGPLNREIGDYLLSKGVKIFNTYASTEIGVANPMVPAAVNEDWEYFRFAENINAKMVPHDDETFELVASPFCHPSIVNTQVDDRDAYATSDLFMEHPQKPGLWRVYGRTDDQIMHSTGEKTNPNPLETILNQDARVKSAVIFGRGQFQAGVIVDPRPQFVFNPSDLDKLAEFRNAIWPTVQRMNAFAPQHSRLFKEMIIISKPSKPFQYTMKNTARRQAIIKDYAEEIRALYDDVIETTQSSIPPPIEWNLTSIMDFVRSTVKNVMKNEVGDDEDIFQRGCDSLQATWIKNTLMRALRDSADVDIRDLTDNFVYEYPSILLMGSFLYSLTSGTTPDGPFDNAARVEAMKKLVAKYSKFALPGHKSFLSSSVTAGADGAVILVTGTTGALGSYLLKELIANPDISKVYAINRKSLYNKPDLKERQERALSERGLNSNSILDTNKVVLVEADISIPNFGLTEDRYKEIQKSVSCIIHNAWPVDFNLALSSFERSVRGVKNLIDFALSSPRYPPATLIYTSSVGVFQNTEFISSSTLPETPIPPEVAVKNGYTESKWVSEEIIQKASVHTPLRCIVVRVGQLCGGLNGAWNTSEWFPALVKSSQKFRSFPVHGSIIHWIPLHLAAKALLDLRLCPANAIIHLIHPRPTSWSSISSVIAAELHLELVSFNDWLKKLEESKGDYDNLANTAVEAMREIPALRLLSFFRSMSRSALGSGSRNLDCEVGKHMSKTLRDPNIAPLSEADVKTWLEYWRRVGFLESKDPDM